MKNPTFKVTGHVATETDGSVKIQGAMIEARFGSRAEADSFASLFPKSLRLVATEVRGNPAGPYGVVVLHVKLGKNLNHGVANETGIRRAQKFLAKVTHVYELANYSNAATVEQLSEVFAA